MLEILPLVPSLLFIAYKIELLAKKTFKLLPSHTYYTMMFSMRFPLCESMIWMFYVRKFYFLSFRAPIYIEMGRIYPTNHLNCFASQCFFYSISSAVRNKTAGAFFYCRVGLLMLCLSHKLDSTDIYNQRSSSPLSHVKKKSQLFFKTQIKISLYIFLN